MLQSNTTQESLFDTPKASIYLDVRPGTMEVWRWNGRGPAFIKLGRAVRYRREDLDAFIEAGRRTSTTEVQGLSRQRWRR